MTKTTLLSLLSKHLSTSRYTSSGLCFRTRLIMKVCQY
ncbi:hypothetical protein [Enterococcus phage vB_EfKS5]|nr:hypothetical protein [Enterococcus phage vB_EfKS5]